MHAKRDGCVLFFMRCPVKGQIKKRLSARLDDDFVLQLYRNFILDSISTLEKLEWKIFICIRPGDSIEECISWLGNDHSFLIQVGSDLGERMKNCFLGAFERGYHRAVLIGSDIPDLPGSIVDDAHSSLESHDAVIGPSDDGGYYLMGFAGESFTPDVFDSMSWGTDMVLQRTIHMMDECGLRYITLPPWNDIDTPDDLLDLVRRNLGTAFRDSRTMSFLIESPEIIDSLDSR